MYTNGPFKVPNKPVRNYKDSEILKKLLSVANEVCPGLKCYTIGTCVESGQTVDLIIDGATDEQCNIIGEMVMPGYIYLEI